MASIRSTPDTKALLSRQGVLHLCGCLHPSDVWLHMVCRILPYLPHACVAMLCLGLYMRMCLSRKPETWQAVCAKALNCVVTFCTSGRKAHRSFATVACGMTWSMAAARLNNANRPDARAALTHQVVPVARLLRWRPRRGKSSHCRTC